MQLSGNTITPVTLYVASGAALLILALSLAFHRRVRPYHFPFQNSLEVYLLLSSMLVIVLGLVYTFVIIHSVAVEVVLLVTIVGSSVAGFAYLLRESFRSGRARRLARCCLPPQDRPPGTRSRARTGASPEPPDGGVPSSVQMQTLPNSPGWNQDKPSERPPSSALSAATAPSWRDSAIPPSPMTPNRMGQPHARCSAAI